MRKLYEKHEILFAVLWILLYCLVMSAIRGQFGLDSPWMPPALLLIAAAATALVLAWRLKEKYGLAGWPKDTKRFLWFIPMWIVATGNLWDGIAPSYQGMGQVFAVLSMLLVGYVEELLFRGFLFKALLADGKKVAAIVISSVTFGLGHIINLLSGQATFETLVQIVFAISWGFIFTMVFFKCGSLFPCILAHSMIDVLSLFGADNALVDWISIGATILVAIFYGLYLSKLKTPEEEKA